MDVLVMGTESLGVRGLSCLVHAGNRRFLMDPGVALGYQRSGLPPHPCQVAIGYAVRKRIISSFRDATDVIISHYHGDHIPLANPNPYQLPLGEVEVHEAMNLWGKGPEGLSPLSLKRRQDLLEWSGGRMVAADGITRPELCISGPVPHGSIQSHLGSVVMTLIRDGSGSFVHASDIQLLNRESTEVIREWRPDVVIASGPPLYLDRMPESDLCAAWQNALDIASCAGTLILDHHLLRSHEGFGWLKRLSDETGGNVLPASEFMGRRPCILEAGREELYDRIPVPAGWHEAYARGDADFWEFVDVQVAGEMKLAETMMPVPIGTTG